MEAAHHHDHDHHDHEHATAVQTERRHEDWFDEEYVQEWIERQDARADERQRQFVIVRSMIPKTPEQEFRYINLGAGPGNLDEVLLERFKGAEAVLVDGSMAMLAEARRRLERFEGRVEYVQANLSTPDWAKAVQGPFDVAVSTIALHNLRDARRLRELYAETFKLLGHGGVFLNLDYMRPPRDELRPLATWAGRDHEAGFTSRFGGRGVPGTVTEQLGWLGEAGFPMADCLWKEFQVALIIGVRDHLHMPEIAEDHDHDHHHDEHGHDHHDDHDHDHDAHAHEEHAHEAHAHH